MQPYCSRCYTTEPVPAETDQGYQFHWFKVSEGDKEELEYLGVDEKGEFIFMFVAILEKVFDYDKSFKLMCPDCLAEEVQKREVQKRDKNKKDPEVPPGSVNEIFN